jgi:hypothetical protein
MAGYTNIVRKKDYIRVNKGQCVFISVLSINN